MPRSHGLRSKATYVLCSEGKGVDSVAAKRTDDHQNRVRGLNRVNRVQARRPSRTRTIHFAEKRFCEIVLFVYRRRWCVVSAIYFSVKC